LYFLDVTLIIGILGWLREALPDGEFGHEITLAFMCGSAGEEVSIVFVSIIDVLFDFLSAEGRDKRCSGLIGFSSRSFDTLINDFDIF
jgi:hypothetical protein